MLAGHVPEPLGKDLYIHRVGLDPRNCLLEGPGTAHDKTVGDLHVVVTSRYKRIAD
jgi:hypothetical protein